MIVQRHSHTYPLPLANIHSHATMVPQHRSTQGRQLQDRGTDRAVAEGSAGSDLQLQALRLGRCGLRLPRPATSDQLIAWCVGRAAVWGHPTRSAGTRAPDSLSIGGETLPPSHAIDDRPTFSLTGAQNILTSDRRGVTARLLRGAV